MKRTILFLAANPRNTARLALDEEYAAIDRELRSTAGRADFELVSRWAVSVDELMRHLNELSPTVLHFSGHGRDRTTDGSGAPGTSHRDVDVQRAAGIVLQDRELAQYVDEHALARMIASASPATRLVVLNACHSDAVAASLRRVVDCVIGVNDAIDDAAARSFAVAFYRALGNHRSVGNAVSQAAATLYGKELPGEIVTCHPRDGISPERMFVADLSIPPQRRQLHAAEVGAVARMTSLLTSGVSQQVAEPYDLFLSHPPANRASAGALYDLLRPDLRVFLTSRSIPPGERCEQTIAAAQHASRATVLLISSQADAAWYLSDETLTALALHHASPAAHRLVPVLMESSLTLPRILGGVEAIDVACVGFLPGVAARLRELVTEFHGGTTPWSRPSLRRASERRANGDHFRIYERLCQLRGALFEQVASCAGIEPSSLAPRATLAERALDIALLAALDPKLCAEILGELDHRASWTRR